MSSYIRIILTFVTRTCTRGLFKVTVTMDKIPGNKTNSVINTGISHTHLPPCCSLGPMSYFKNFVTQNKIIYVMSWKDIHVIIFYEASITIRKTFPSNYASFGTFLFLEIL